VLIGQAGFYADGMLRGMKHMGFATVATIGNRADIDETDILVYLGDDNNIDVICIFLQNKKRVGSKQAKRSFSLLKKRK